MRKALSMVMDTKGIAEKVLRKVWLFLLTWLYLQETIAGGGAAEDLAKDNILDYDWINEKLLIEQRVETSKMTFQRSWLFKKTST
ncbi:hypothetical protein ACP8HZ_09785 [Francisella noatunensis]